MKKPFILGLAFVLLAAGSAGAQEIFDAVKAGDLARTKALVEKDASLVRARDASGNTPLHAAAIVGSVPMTDWLLSKGAEIDADNLESMTPLLEAVRNEKDDVALLLIDRGADIEKGSGALMLAAQGNRLAVAERLIAKGADIEKKRGEYTPLGYIARTGFKSFEVFELLMRKGAQYNLRDSLGHTPLDNTVFYGGDDRIIGLLLDRSAEVATDRDSLEELVSIAARRGHQRLFEYYSARGGEALFSEEPNRRRFMRGAILGGSVDLVKKLQARGIPLDFSPNVAGMTPLHRLSFNPQTLRMIEFLAANGADLDVRTKDGRSAYNIAQTSGNQGAADLLARLGASTGPQKFPILTGPYLGETPPGDELQMFAPGIILDQDHGTIAFSPDGLEAYWPTGKAIKMMKVRDGRWTEPAYAPFSGPSEIDFYDDVPFVTPDDKRLFFTSKRPVGSGMSQKENIWFVERTADGWSEPRPVGPAVNSLRLHWQVSVSSSGTLYFGGFDEKDGRGGQDIYYSRLVDGRYTEPVNPGSAVNTKDHEGQPYIAPDESYILFWRAAGQVPTACVSFKGSDGGWRPAVKLDLSWAPGGLMVTPDGKYLFTGNRWMSAKFLEELRPKSELDSSKSQKATEDANKALVRRYFAAMTDGDLAAVKEIFSPDCVIHHTTGEDWSLEKTFEAVKEQNTQSKVMLPDLTFHQEETFASGDKAVLMFTFKGTHVGDIEGIPATGNTVRGRSITIFRFADGKIVEGWQESNVARLYRQLGFELKPRDVGKRALRGREEDS